MKMLYFIDGCDDDGEWQAFFNAKTLDVVAYWASNDANYRSEYMGGLLAYLGANVIQIDEDNSNYSDLKARLN